MRHAPSVPEIVRVDTSSLNSAVAHLISALEPTGGNFNYLDGTKRVRSAHKGLHDLKALMSASPSRAKMVGHAHNMDVVRLAAPNAFGRKTSVFNLPPRKLPYGGDRLASYRLPFFFVEEGSVKGYFLQPRKNTHFTTEQYGLMATVVKRNLLDTEFYGERVEFEVVDVSRKVNDNERSLSVYTLSELQLWSEADVAQHFRVVAAALNIIEDEQLVKKVRRPLRDKELPLFD
ncbi:hypothetical protein SAMN04488498_11280 [Mesorhizobium albiziae]|uniref:Uncharacterized protein n=1 Tax=Neomesorhizobium albiziae TaxID=335020 RepID=A0A1I4C813_9HYPH|nr:hypothetical protein [Mesorhizobium albiziae]GLS29486.1 hypothetical protein GCM10007937_11940 [Mesorhizobium albiziae]SFK77284.1 hypothetical protein SAMN04488498_11280 [Mesorhizobium albiziae]